MKLNTQDLLDSIEKNGGIVRSYGNSIKSNFLNAVKNTIITGALLSSFSVSASNLPNQSEEPTGKPIEIVQTLISPDNITNTFNNNYIALQNLKSGKYDGIAATDLTKANNKNHMAEDIQKDKRNIRAILSEESKKAHIKGNIIEIEEFGVSFDKNESAENIQKKLLEVSNTHEKSDVRVRSKVMAFIITNEGLSSNVGLDAQNHLTVGYGYDVDQQIKSRVYGKITTEFAKKHVYKELASAGISVDQLVNSYNGKSNKITITPAQATLLSAKTMDRYLAYAKTAAGPKLWGLVAEDDVKPSDYYKKDWTESDMQKKGGYYNSYFNLDDRMKAAYVYSTYNFGPRSFGAKVRTHLENGNHHSAINSITSTWKDKNGVVHKNYRWMNNMAFAMSSDQTMMTFINKESDKYIKTEIRNALSSESPEVDLILKLTEKYNQNIKNIAAMDIKELKGETLNAQEKEKYAKLTKQSNGLIENINKKRIEIGETPIEAYDKKKHIVNFEDMKKTEELAIKYNQEKSAYNDEVMKNYDSTFEEVSQKFIEKDQSQSLKNGVLGNRLKALYLGAKSEEFKPSPEIADSKNLDKIKELAILKQEEEINAERLKLEESSKKITTTPKRRI